MTVALLLRCCSCPSCRAAAKSERPEGACRGAGPVGVEGRLRLLPEGRLGAARCCDDALLCACGTGTEELDPGPEPTAGNREEDEEEEEDAEEEGWESDADA